MYTLAMPLDRAPQERYVTNSNRKSCTTRWRKTTCIVDESELTVYIYVRFNLLLELGDAGRFPTKL